MGVTALAPAASLEAVRKLLLDAVRSPLTRVMLRVAGSGRSSNACA